MLVLDTSAVFDMLADAPGAAAVRDRMTGEVLFAPHQMDVELLSVVERYVRGGVLTPEQGAELLQDFEDLRISRWMFAGDLRNRAFALRDHVSAYDAPFVTLAESMECPLITRDGRLSRSTGHDAQIEVI